MSSFERLSALDATFLAIDDDPSTLQFAVVAILNKTSLTATLGVLDEVKIRACARSAIQSFPRFRRRLTHVPFVNHPVLVDDPEFDLEHHVHFVRLSAGDEAELKQLVARICDEPLARERALWGQWYVDGLAQGRCAVITKVHHALIGGISSVAAWSAFLNGAGADPGAKAELGGGRAPAGSALLQAEWARYTRTLTELGSGIVRDMRAARSLRSGAGRIVTTSRERVKDLSSLFVGSRAPASSAATGLGSGRGASQVEWLSTPVEVVLKIAQACDVQVHDVVLTALSAALGWYLDLHGNSGDGSRIQALIAEGTRSGPSPHRASLMTVQLPLFQQDAKVRLRRVAGVLQTARASIDSAPLASAERVADLTFVNWATRAALVATRRRSYDLIVSAVAAPSADASLLGAHPEALYPILPLYLNAALSVCMMNYSGLLFLGMRANTARITDLDELKSAVLDALTELQSRVLGPS
jgi:diacylglycerol O-acyltransferase